MGRLPDFRTLCDTKTTCTRRRQVHILFSLDFFSLLFFKVRGAWCGGRRLLLTAGICPGVLLLLGGPRTADLSLHRARIPLHHNSSETGANAGTGQINTKNTPGRQNANITPNEQHIYNHEITAERGYVTTAVEGMVREGLVLIYTTVPPGPNYSQPGRIPLKFVVEAHTEGINPGLQAVFCAARAMFTSTRN